MKCWHEADEGQNIYLTPHYDTKHCMKHVEVSLSYCSKESETFTLGDVIFIITVTGNFVISDLKGFAD